MEKKYVNKTKAVMGNLSHKTKTSTSNTEINEEK
jgi:hypothetical protein